MPLQINLEGKAAIVTGAGRGIGKAIALCLAEAGADVCVTARTTSEINETAEKIRAVGRRSLAVSADARDADAVSSVVAQAVSEFGGLHILINNAGMELAKPLMKTEPDEFEQVMDTNLKSMFCFTKAVGHHFIHQKYGRIVNVASVGSFVAAPNQSVYHASKGAVAQFTKAVAIEWARYHIHVNAVAPGWTRTELIRHLLDNKEKLSGYTGAIPLRRLGEPEDIAPAAVFLCSDLASYMTGSIVVIDGGLMIP